MNFDQSAPGPPKKRRIIPASDQFSLIIASKGLKDGPSPLIHYYRSPNPRGKVTSADIRPSDVQLSPHTQGDLRLRLSTGFGSVLVEDGICLGPTAFHTQVDEDSL